MICLAGRGKEHFAGGGSFWQWQLHSQHYIHIGRAEDSFTLFQAHIQRLQSTHGKKNVDYATPSNLPDKGVLPMTIHVFCCKFPSCWLIIA